MKTCALYGFISALAGAFLTLIMFFLGWHSDASKLGLASGVGSVGGLAIYATCIALGVKGRRDETPAVEGFGYGRALGAGLGVASISTLLSTIFSFCYNTFINPAFTDLLLQDRIDKIESSMSGDKLEKTEQFTRMMFHPLPLAIYFVIIGMVLGLVISLIVAAVLKREPVLPPRV
jgi:hypothetical protein